MSWGYYTHIHALPTQMAPCADAPTRHTYAVQTARRRTRRLPAAPRRLVPLGLCCRNLRTRYHVRQRLKPPLAL